MNQKKLSQFALMILVGAAILHPIFATGQTPTPGIIRVVIDSITTSFGPQDVTPSAKFSHKIGNSLTVFYHVNGGDFDNTSKCYRALVEIDLLEDGVKVAFQQTCPPYDKTPTPVFGVLTYKPSHPGVKTLTVVATTTLGTLVSS